MPVRESGEYEPTPALGHRALPSTRVQRVGKYRCAKCGLTISPEDMEVQEPWIGRTCPRCFIRALSKSFPQMTAILVAEMAETSEEAKAPQVPRAKVDERKMTTRRATRQTWHRDRSKNKPPPAEEFDP